MTEVARWIEYETSIRKIGRSFPLFSIDGRFLFRVKLSDNGRIALFRDSSCNLDRCDV